MFILVVEVKVEEYFSFQLDDFQQAAIESLRRRENVLVAAPTGSGKTVIAEAAIYLALAAGKRIFYTTPLKALSNQKFRDCQRVFGVSRVGLLTGDVTIQRDADILVLTTEIYRNMLYADTTSISDSVFAVVFDEFHFMNDPERGTVWEEAIIASPKEVILVALSATMSNAAQLKDWLSNVHRKTSLHETHVRPVPLHFQFCNHKGLHDLLHTSKKDENACSALSKTLLFDYKQHYQVDKNKRRRNRSTLRSLQSPSVGFLVRILFRRKMLPCILFVFSRAGCDRAAEELGDKLRSHLVTKREQQVLQSRIFQFIDHFPEIAAQQEDRLKLLQLGISVHHAGLLPVWKNFVEELFIEGLIKVIFATETLAAGMNMPARTTVISALFKRGDNGMERLSTSSFQQMAGRAGRRGKDSQGFCVVLQSPDTHPKHVFQLVTGNVEAITSKFLPTYGLVLNLLQDGKSPQQVKDFLGKSFGNFLFAYERKRQEQEKENELQKYNSAMKTLTENNIVLEEWKRYRRLQQKLKMERRTLRYLTKQWIEMQRQLVEECLLYANVGVVLWIDDDSSSNILENMHYEQNETMIVEDVDKERQVAWLLKSYPFKDNELYLCFTERNHFRVVTCSQILAVSPNDSPFVLQPDRIEYLMEEYNKQRQQDKVTCDNTFCIGTERTASMLVNIPKECYLLENMKERDPKLLSQRRKVLHILTQLEQSPVHHLKNRKELLRLYDKVNKWLKKKSPEECYDDQMTKSWDYVQSLLKTLNTLSFIENIRFTTEETWYRVTALGRLCVAIRGENEVWLSIVLGYLGGQVQTYEPHHLIGVVATVIGDPIREDAVINWEASSITLTLLEQLQVYYDQVVSIQNQHGIVCFTRMEPGWSGIAETWAKEANWSRLVSGTSLDEGDICRNLRRVLDILRQIPRLPAKQWLS
ncbi:ATP-dependent RNA helicase [Galdieria sulphuraria]|uniref:ATP-dependent RNA helicase n=1 Tax=Galdieria sulphuraria TaxID=130081 RepID=M2W218_GALSU|nr:ATP-dependent RNA helicase [Galdieria sulphuraria]EME29731.1 ATP-dependent RNA helicase [Galdieria sulphuraria]|eukprot:XP_005706251.1 ATP-dependent RNA helicase [Galdieria sulphuraria]